jgi:FAD/FMN-containing dehydrogenase/Fe-S oxidoreductase
MNKIKESLVLEGEVLTDISSLLIYSTDASAYREIPLAVAYPKSKDDIWQLIDFANKNKLGLVPRTAGTSLAGQVVGNGIIVDFSRYYNNILEVNIYEKWIRVQPGVVLDEMNLSIKKHGLFFGPETSTSNRCMIGGMVGNNACGAHSLLYGSTRDHLLEIKGFLSDGNEVVFKNCSVEEFEMKCIGNSLENNIYRQIKKLLSNAENQKSIIDEFPEPRLKRRNTGYAMDLLLDSQVFSNSSVPFNFCKLIAGSEGTLMVITEIKLNLVPLPPKEKGLVCIHFETLEEALQGNLLCLKHKPDAIELIDRIILNCTKDNIDQSKNRFFIDGDPGAIIIVEFSRNSQEEIKEAAVSLENDMRLNGLGYHFPLVLGEDMKRVWALRKAALGLLSNIPGDAKPVSLVEDTAVYVEKLPSYIAEFKKILERYNLTCVFHAHISTGELHLRPILNLKDIEHVKIFRSVATEVAHLVKKYKGSLSGEHGDGRLRGEFIPIIIGEKNFGLVKEIKLLFDPNNIFNPGKIVNTPLMDKQLRYLPSNKIKNIETYFDFTDSQGILRHAEKCNGSADCRKSEIMGGTMCPSYMATRKESTTTRARANILREYLTNSTKKNPFDHKEIKEVLDLCLSCKACKAECPSNVDMTKLKAEFLQQYQDIHGIPMRSRFIANMPLIYRIGSNFPSIFNFCITNKTVSGIIKKGIGFAPKRNIPALEGITVRKWCYQNLTILNDSIKNPIQEVCIFIDEFTNYTDTLVGIKAITLLTKLNYKVIIAKCIDSGRASFSKGMLKKAKKISVTNVNLLKNTINNNLPLIGIEPSSILCFRDEYPEIVTASLKEEALKISSNTFLIEEFIAQEIAKGNLSEDNFITENRQIQLHGHCYIKAIASTKPIITILSFPKNYKVTEMPTGCCGMAGAFGYEKEHYDISMKIGSLILFPAVKKLENDSIIAASGTSCRQQIFDGSGKRALHPVEILYDALKSK